MTVEMMVTLMKITMDDGNKNDVKSDDVALIQNTKGAKSSISHAYMILLFFYKHMHMYIHVNVNMMMTMMLLIRNHHMIHVCVRTCICAYLNLAQPIVVKHLGQQFFSGTAVDPWNDLDDSTVSADSITAF